METVTPWATSSVKIPNLYVFPIEIGFLHDIKCTCGMDHHLYSTLANRVFYLY